MVQVLHLLSEPATLEAAHVAASISGALGADATITTRTIGRGGSYRNAAFAAMALRFGKEPLFDIVHAFDANAALAAFAGPSPVIFTPTQLLGNAPRWLGPALVYRNGAVAATTNAARQQLLRQGVPPFRCEVVRPPLAARPISDLQRSQLRLSLGISPDRRVLLAPGESLRPANHLLAMHTVSILHVLNERYCLLLWGRGPCLGAVRRLAQNLKQPNVLIVAEQTLERSIAFEELLPAADAGLFPACELASGFPLGLCLAAGLPIIATPGPASAEVLEGGQDALICPKPAPRLLAQHIIRVFEEPDLAAKLGHAGRHRAAQLFHPQTQADEYRSLYYRTAGLAPKGGLRDNPEIAAAIATAV